VAILNIGPAITKDAIRGAVTQMVGTVDLFKQRDQALVGLLASVADADLIALGFTQAEVTFLRTGIGAFDQMVTQGLANATIAAFVNAARNFGQ
jgi:hypothetical protein